MNKEIIISTKTVLIAFLMILGFYVVYRLGHIIGLFAVALLIVFALEPFIKKIMNLTVLNKKVSRTAAVAFAYLSLVLLVAVFLTIWLPPFVTETQKLLKNLPKIANNITLSDQWNLRLSDFMPQASVVSGNVLSAGLSIFSNITTMFSVFIMALYMSLDWPNVKRRVSSLFPSKADDLIFDGIDEVEQSLGNWVKGEAILMLVVGLASFIGLLLLDVPYPLSLGLISGLLEIVPMVGPVISAVFAAIIALADSPAKAVGVVILFIIIQQLENNFLVPKVMQKVSGFSPLVILFALLVGSEFFGMTGAVMAVPGAMALGIIIKRAFRYKR
jgi:predicted PurR-regulated permease PerM